MGSPVTLSGFNNIDFNQILTSIMTQESRPLEALQSRQAALQSRSTSFGVLASRVAAMQTAATKLSTAGGVSGFAATSNTPAAVSVSASTSAIPGRYDVVVNDLARAQVTASVTTAPDADTTIVASGGTLTIGGVTVTLTGAATLRQLADAINSSSNPPARASVVQSGPSSYRLVVSAVTTGAANAFTITNALTGGIGIAFGDADNNGVSGDSPADNAVQASNASLLVNNIPITSSTNVIDSAIPGVTLTAFKKDPAATVIVDVAPDSAALKSKVKDLVTAYNDLVKFAVDQSAAAGRGDPSIGRDPVLRQLRNQLRSALSAEYPTGGAYTALSQVGVEFTQQGTLKFDEAALDKAAANGTAGVSSLFVGTSGAPGVFAALGSLLDGYNNASGLLPGARKQLSDQATRLSDQISTMQDRLALRRAALQREFTAADQALSQLKSQSQSLTSFGAQL